MSILWGGNIVSIRIGVDSVPPLWSAFWRMLVGTMVVTAWAWKSGAAIWPARGEWRHLLILGALFTGQIGLLNSGSAYTSPAFGVVILNSYAVFANIVGHFFLPELETPLTRVRVGGLVIALVGITVLALGQTASTLAPKPLLGNSLLVISALLLGIRMIFTRWLVQHVEPTKTVIWQMAWSVPLFFLIAVVSEPMVRGERASTQAIVAIAYQGFIVAGICFIVWAELLKKHSAGTLSMFGFLVPITGIGLSTILFDERITAPLVIGSLLALAGVWIVTRSDSAPASPEELE